MSSYSTKPNPWSGIPLVGTLIDAIQTYLHTTIDSDISSAIATQSPSPTWYTGSAAPTTLHNNGDYYVRTTNGEVYKQVSGAWVDQAFVLPAGSIPDGIVTSTKIAAGAVGSTQIASGAVGAAQIAAGAVGTSQIATGAVTSTQIADGTIVDADISASAAMAISKLAGYPSDGTKFPAGDGTWKASSVTYRSTSTIQVVNTTAESNLSTLTVGAGALGTSGVIRYTLWGDMLNGTTGTSPRFRAYLGSTCIFDTGAITGIYTTSHRDAWKITVEIMNRGSASSQLCYFCMDATWDYGGNGLVVWNMPGGFLIGEGGHIIFGSGNTTSRSALWNGTAYNSAAVNMGVAQNVALNVIMGAAAANQDVTCYGALVEVL